ncbi:MAG: hypothetical protein FWE04_03260 [Oscillospiraceae bacterium]|nr:hypothetical protein [Oscillospiraceae bacterium]
MGEQEQAKKMAKSVTDLSAKSIITACKLAGYDVRYRAGAAYYKPISDILPDDNTIKNIEIMINRAVKFFEEYGPVVEDGFTFSGGYTKTVSKGDGDFITADTMWDFKVLRSEPDKNHTLQLLMYYLMGKRSTNKNLHNTKRLGIFNPRLNKVYLLDVLDVQSEIIDEVERDVICY